MSAEQDFEPDWVSAPGETIRDILYAQHKTPYILAQEIGLSFEQMQMLLSGKERITETLAVELSRTLGATVEFWRAREHNYRKAILRLKYPHAVKFELLDGNGVLLEPVCALCHEPMVSPLQFAPDHRVREHDWTRSCIKCDICDRSFCVSPCYGVHLEARDQFDSAEAVEAMCRDEVIVTTKALAKKEHKP